MCKNDYFLHGCFDGVNMKNSAGGLMFTLLKTGTLPAVGATIHVYGTWDNYSHGTGHAITLGRNTWCNSDGTGDDGSGTPCPVAGDGGDSGGDSGGESGGTTDQPTKWYATKPAVIGYSVFMSFATVLVLLLAY